MRGYTLGTCQAVLVLAFAGASQPLGATPIETLVEAESTAYTATWVLQTGQALASGQQYLMVPTSAPKQSSAAAGSAPEVSFPVEIPFTGTYKIWLRVLAPNNSAKSFLWTVGNADYKDFYVPASSNWQWVSITTSFNAGTQQVNIKYREPGVGLDRLMVSALPTFVPIGFGANPSLPPVAPPAHEHPRLFLRGVDLARIRDQVANSETSTVWNRMKATAIASHSGVLPVPGTKTNYNADLLSAIRAKALWYLLEQNQDQGADAVRMMGEFLGSVKFSDTDDSRQMGDTILTSAMVYDWCFPLLTDSDKSAFIDTFKVIAPKMETGFPPAKQGSLVGHGAENLVLRDQLAAGVAFFDENPDLYNMVARRFFTDYVDARNYSYQAQAHHQGVAYGPIRYMGDMYAAWIFKRMGAGDVFSTAQQMTPYHWLYLRRPDGQLLRDGDVYQSNYMKPGQYWNEPIAYLLPSSYYGDPILKQELLTQMSAVAAMNGTVTADDVWHILFDDTGVPTQAAQALPLTKYFPGPVGAMAARTAWGDGVVALMKVGEMQYSNHQHADSGSFQLYYKGGLAISSGIYQGTYADGKKQEYGGIHDLNYYKRTVAHNSLLIFNPSESFAGNANDGGQRLLLTEPFSQAALLSQSDPANSYVFASVLRHQYGPDQQAPDFSYLKGDLTKAYTATKAADVRRSFVFLNLKDSQHPASLVVFDKVTSQDASFKKTWLLHTQAEPVISGNMISVQRTGGGYNGRLVNQTLLPADGNLAMVKVGGSGNEFTVNGTNYPIYPSNPSSNTEEAGAWRVEVSSQVAATTDLFLNVMQVMDASGGPEPLPTQAIANDLLVGVKIQQRAVLFSRSGADLGDSVVFTLPASEASTLVLITDLVPGTWYVGKTGEAASAVFEVKAGEGTIYYSAPTGGSYTLRRDASAAPN